MGIRPPPRLRTDKLEETMTPLGAMMARTVRLLSGAVERDLESQRRLVHDPRYFVEPVKLVNVKPQPNPGTIIEWQRRAGFHAAWTPPEPDLVMVLPSLQEGSPEWQMLRDFHERFKL